MQEAHGTHSLPRPQRSSPGGTVTAGNSSGINDGAAALLVASERAVQRYGLAPLARVTAGAAFAFDREGALVAAIDRNRAEAELTAKEITRQGGTALPFTADVTCEDDVHATVDGLSVRAT